MFTTMGIARLMAVNSVRSRAVLLDEADALLAEINLLESRLSVEKLQNQAFVCQIRSIGSCSKVKADVKDWVEVERFNLSMLFCTHPSKWTKIRQGLMGHDSCGVLTRAWTWEEEFLTTEDLQNILDTAAAKGDIILPDGISALDVSVSDVRAVGCGQVLVRRLVEWWHYWQTHPLEDWGLGSASLF
jgi:hypothetical protein